MSLTAVHRGTAPTSWRAEYRDFRTGGPTGGLPASVRLTSLDSKQFDLRLALSQVEVNVGPADCNTYGKSAVNTPCAAYPALWTTAQRSGKIGSQSQGVRRGLIDPPDGKLPWNREGRAKYDDIIKNIYDPPTLSYLDPHARCMLPGVPRGGPGGIQILQIPGHVVLFLEYDHVAAFEVSKRTLVDESNLRCAGDHRERHRRDGSRR